MSKADERRAEQEKYLDPIVTRPVVAVRAIPEAEQCPAKLGSRHDYSMVTQGPEGFSDARSARVVKCWFCCALSPTSEQRIAAWKEKNEEQNA